MTTKSMEVKDFQKLSTETVKKIDGKHDISRDAQLSLSQLVEEIGELAKVANLKRLRNKDPEKKDLEDEFADALIQLFALANIFQVDLEKSVLDKIETLKQRHNI